MRIVSITAGAAGMFCGSCMRDNTLATALIALGHDALLVPTYTPITTDEPDASTGGRIFFGGVNVFLEQWKVTAWAFRRTPRFIDALFNDFFALVTVQTAEHRRRDSPEFGIVGARGKATDPSEEPAVIE